MSPVISGVGQIGFISGKFNGDRGLHIGVHARLQPIRPHIANEKNAPFGAFGERGGKRFNLYP